MGIEPKLIKECPALSNQAGAFDEDKHRVSIRVSNLMHFMHFLCLYEGLTY